MTLLFCLLYWHMKVCWQVNTIMMYHLCPNQQLSLLKHLLTFVSISLYVYQTKSNKAIFQTRVLNRTYFSGSPLRSFLEKKTTAKSVSIVFTTVNSKFRFVISDTYESSSFTSSLTNVASRTTAIFASIKSCEHCGIVKRRNTYRPTSLSIYSR